jgi:hypothetical protein
MDINPNLQGFLLAMPEGSEWRVFDHREEVDVGQISVLHHRRSGLEIYVHKINKRMTLPYPEAGYWVLHNDHVRIGNKEKGLVATYAPT